MHTDIIFVQAKDDQEEAARKIQKYDLIALPVINDENILSCPGIGSGRSQSEGYSRNIV